MYEVKYENGEWRIARDGKIIDIIAGFSDPLTPKIIIEMIENEQE